MSGVPQKARWHPARKSLCGHQPLRLGAREPRRIKHSARLTFHLRAPGLRLHTDVIKLQTLQPRLFFFPSRRAARSRGPEAGSEKFVFQ